MIGIDTNILARHYTQDDPVQSPQATAFLRDRCLEQNPGWISVPVVCELFWVLHKACKHPKAEVLKVMRVMRNTRGLLIENEDAFDAATALYETSSADFPDCLIVARHQKAGVARTYTFDVNAAKLDGCELLS